MKAAYKSHAGRGRENNQDRLFVDPEIGLFIVADGMGGHQAGEVASSMAVDYVSNHIRSFFSSCKSEGTAEELLEQAISGANESIRRKSSEDPDFERMGTTIVVGLHLGASFYLSHVGDSRAYLVRNGNIEQLTRDHSVVAELASEGIIAPEKAKTHHMRHVLTRALGILNDISCDTNVVRWEPEDYLLLCTDGLTDGLDDPDILLAVLSCDGDPALGCEMLVDQANRKSGKDNVSVILLFNDLPKEKAYLPGAGSDVTNGSKEVM